MKNPKHTLFPIDTPVSWTSARKQKAGTVVAHVPAGAQPRAFAAQLGLGATHDITTALNGSGARGHDTVLVSAPGDNARCQPVIYRPLLSALRATAQASTAPVSAPAASEPAKGKKGAGKAKKQERPITQTVAQSIGQAAAPLVNHIGIALDASGSMTNQHVIGPATAAMNEQIRTIQEQAQKTGQKTDITFFTFDAPGDLLRHAVAKPAAHFQPYPTFDANGAWTALYDATGDLVETLRGLPDAREPHVSFLLLIVTDGGENHSRSYNAARLRALIHEVHSTDRWTIAFLVPPGQYKADLERNLGIPAGNVQEWTISDAGAKQAGRQAAVGTEAFYTDRAAGKTSTKEFFGVDLSRLGGVDLKKLVDVTSILKTRKVDKAGRKIGEFMEQWTKKPYIRGTGYYPFGLRDELLKQGRGIIIRRRGESTFYGGPAMRDVTGIPADRDVTIKPQNLGAWEMWVESGSDNRGLQLGTTILWNTAHTGGTVPTWSYAASGNGAKQPAHV